METGNTVLKEELLFNDVRLFTSKKHTFGTDAVLLADFAAPSKQDIACDLGTGCGIIPLLWCSFGLCSEIVGVEIQEDACLQAEKSVLANSLENKVKIVSADLKNLKGILPFGKFDLVTMNPPYQSVGSGIISRTDSDKIARHEVSCTVFDIAETAASLLRFGGRFCLCYRPERLVDVFEALRESGCEPKRIRFVHKKPGERPWLVMIESKTGRKSGLTVEAPLYIYKNNDFSSEYKKIYSAYYE